MTPGPDDVCKECKWRAGHSPGCSQVDRPIGFAEAQKDWNEAFAGRPMTIADWHRLTFGEQADYRKREQMTEERIVIIVAETIERSMFAPHELPLSLELHEKYMATARDVINELKFADQIKET